MAVDKGLAFAGRGDGGEAGFELLSAGVGTP
jgi:hypothetical protein